MHPSRDLVHQGRQYVDIGGLKLCETPVIDDLARELMDLRQFFKDVHISRKARFRSFRGIKPEISEEDRAQLLRGINIEFFACDKVDPSLKTLDLDFHLL